MGEALLTQTSAKKRISTRQSVVDWQKLPHIHSVLRKNKVAHEVLRLLPCAKTEAKHTISNGAPRAVSYGQAENGTYLEANSCVSCATTAVFRCKLRRFRSVRGVPSTIILPACRQKTNIHREITWARQVIVSRGNQETTRCVFIRDPVRACESTT